jgi:RNA polymerase subunit RPABC4/transcription elongation factor Spt4
MAFYKQECIQCGTLIDRDAEFCPFCGSHSPFGYKCPSCLRQIEKEQRICAGCGRALYIPCPHCGKITFVQEICQNCGQTLMIVCQNPRCKKLQFFENKKCNACGKKIRGHLN